VKFPNELPIPKEVVEIARTLEQAGFETWCVGGAVRDNLLGHANRDFDLATAARPEQVQELFKRTIPIGVEHGTVAVLDRNRQPHEVTTFREDIATDGRHAVVEFGVSLDQDLARRDFTINAIAYHPLKHEWRDRYEGMADLDRGLVRAVGDPGQRFQEDFLRILRALRFAARFGFDIESATWEAAKAQAHGLPHLSAERVRDEWSRGLETARHPSWLVEQWAEVGALETWLPEVAAQGGGGVSGEAVARQVAGVSRWAAIDRLEPRDPVLVTSYLSADPGATLERLRCSNADIERGRRVGAHRGPTPDPESPVEVRRWMSACGAAVDDLVAIAKAEGRGARLAEAVRAIRASGAPLAVGDLAIDGNRLMELGVPKGPKVGETLRALLDRSLEDPNLNTEERLVELVRSAE
jgi:tRNA nucleotidyltransferase (CCA-adding enzyme)